MRAQPIIATHRHGSWQVWRVSLTSSRRRPADRKRGAGEGAGVTFLPAALLFGFAARWRDLAKARREHLPRRDVVWLRAPWSMTRRRSLSCAPHSRVCTGWFDDAFFMDPRRFRRLAMLLCVGFGYPNYDHRSRKKERRENGGLVASFSPRSTLYTRETRMMGRVRGSSFPVEESISRWERKKRLKGTVFLARYWDRADQKGWPSMIDLSAWFFVPFLT